MGAADWILPCLAAFFAGAGFCVLFNIHGPGLLICSGGSALGWLVYLLAKGPSGGSDIIQTMAAAVAIAIYAEVMARIRKCPVTTYLLIASLPLVPGAGIYYTMTYAAAGDTERFMSSLIHTMGLAGAMALGILMVGSVVRLAAGERRRRERARREKGEK